MKSGYSIRQRVRSLRHRFWYGVSERVRWSRGVFREIPAGVMAGATAVQAQRIGALREIYLAEAGQASPAPFELSLSEVTALNNYEYLDMLDRAWAAGACPRPRGGVVCDVGCASFWYAAALNSFFRPRELVGVEVEGHRLFKGGRARIDYAAGYTEGLPNSRFLVADYRGCELPADVITAWFPFVSAAALLAWRLPLSLLAPESLFERIRVNLNEEGLFVMVNHGPHEAQAAETWCGAAGLVRVGVFAEPGVFSGHRLETAILSSWRRC